MILNFLEFIQESKISKKGKEKSPKIVEKKCRGCGRKVSECDLPDCGAGFYGPEMVNPVYH